MKKSLLFCLAAAAAINPAFAEIKAPQIHPGASFQRVSANGNVALSEVYGTILIFNLEDGSIKEYAEDADNGISYKIGEGNCITADGSFFTGSTSEHSNACYWTAGEWHSLPVLSEEMSNLSNGVTPDGSRICGSLGLSEMTMDEVTMQVPCYWDRNADGTYGEPQRLPCPNRDLFDCVPQYVTAVCISDDGKTIIGQMVFSSGAMTIPVLYTEAADGTWTYSLPTKNLFNPDGLVLPENPGEFEEYPPSYEDYMTEDELAAYTEAINKYYQDQDWSAPYPEFTDYMSADKKAEYEAALAGWQQRQDEFMEKYNAYRDVVEQIEDASPNFLFNNLFLSLDGKYYVGALESPDPNADPWSWFRNTIYTPCMIDLATGQMIKIETDLSLIVSGVADGGVILAHNGVGAIPMLGYVIKDGVVESIDAYLSAINPEYGQWIKANLTHEIVTGFDPDTYDDVYEELTYTGMPVSSSDMSVITIWNNCPWWNYEYMAEGVIFFVEENNALGNVAADYKEMTLADGGIDVPEGYVSLKVYDLGGVCMQSVEAPKGFVKLNVANGLYIAKGVRADGSQTVLKICF